MACASMVAKMAHGMHVDQAEQINEENVVQDVALPEGKRECSAIAVSALHEAIYSYVFSSRERIDSGRGK